MAENDAELKDQFATFKEEKARCERIRNRIRDRNLNYMRGMDNMNEFIDYCEAIVAIVENDAGYNYVNNLASNLKEDLKVLKDYRDYARDANNSFVELYEKLEAEIARFDRQIAAVKAAYNEGKSFWDRI